MGGDRRHLEPSASAGRPADRVGQEHDLLSCCAVPAHGRARHDVAGVSALGAHAEPDRGGPARGDSLRYNQLHKPRSVAGDRGACDFRGVRLSDCRPGAVCQ